jgi:predicted Zn finger-like uncharacterized protein
MLVTCPECGARYDIDGSLIPASGRRVQCSACDHVWLQDGEAGGGDPLRAVPSDADATGSGAADEGPAPRRPLAEGVRSILREEAAHDSRVRRQRGLREVQPERAAAPEYPGPVHGPSEPGSLPDPEAINATLRAASSRAEPPAGSPERKVGGFRVGFGIGLGLVGLAALLYGLAEPLGTALPAAGALLDPYVAAVDELLRAIGDAIGGVGDAAADV